MLSGERLGIGRHHFEFVASDEEGNESICEFKIHILRQPTEVYQGKNIHREQEIRN